MEHRQLVLDLNFRVLIGLGFASMKSCPLSSDWTKNFLRHAGVVFIQRKLSVTAATLLVTYQSYLMPLLTASRPARTDGAGLVGGGAEQAEAEEGHEVWRDQWRV